ncbi:histidine phosphatase family protein [Sphingosinicella sp. CPCC 101087]|uniref:SixA phosphatase family protein n=1 Tax=Sphingosinicella sp. CPCC 101087 TaxID=2497754 RepID=UPI00101BEDA6|nr:histidine phosphatase family protein [Sphingosinicella sp. CPCC 101087]
MKTLTLLRHAKSGWDDPALRDFDRPLNKRGRRAARTIGREMRARGLAFDAIVASPAARVVETLADVAHGYGGPIDPEFDPRVYLASAATLLELVREANDSADRLLLVGHNPGLEMLALLLTEAEPSNGLRRDLAEKYPTATLAEIALPVDHWNEVEAGSGRLSRFIRPRDVDPELGPEE